MNPLRFSRTVGGDRQLFSGVVHRSGAYVILELELLDLASNENIQANSPFNFFDFYRMVKRPVSRFQQAQTLWALCQAAVEEIQKITGFDRVMVYQFDADGSGSVIAEVKQTDQTPYLGLHYPPTDIPKQAKYLYLLNLLRLIPEVGYTPVPLVSADEDAVPLDMSLAGLRSVSPLHTEYLSNMGVSATLAISLVVQDELWGMVVCHHCQPRNLSYEYRTVCEFLAQAISLELASKEKKQNQDHRLKIKTLQASFVETLPNASNLKEGLTQDEERILALTGAAGAAYCEKGEITLIGQTPTMAEMGPMLTWLSGQFKEDSIYQTCALSNVYMPAAHFDERISGLLAVAISQVQQLYVVWFRPEVIQTVNWAGNPSKAMEADEKGGELRLLPRRSFALWQEQVQLRSLPWQACEIEAALELRSAVIGLVLQRADELATLNLELERSNIELDAFAYIASHDLKEPIRGIHNYSSFLIEDYGETLGEDGRHKLETLMRLTTRMEDLISSLLHYSRLGRAELEMTSVNLNQLVEGVIELVQMSKQEQVSFVVPRLLPTVLCDQVQVTELFTNLITNAIKYNNKADKQVEIGFFVGEEGVQQAVFPEAMQQTLSAEAVMPHNFYVKDNGIGIRQKHQDTVFRIFKRLHAPSRFGGGTGAGLTIAKKIVERHSGEIWLRSTYNQGSCFYFTLSGGES